MDPDLMMSSVAGMGGEAAPIGLGPAPTPGNADPQAAYAQAPAPTPPPVAPPQSQAGGLGSLFGLFGAGGQGAAPAADATRPGWQQGAIGLGLGMLAGNPFDRWGPALKGYQAGAAQDVARAQQAETAKYHQQSLAQTAELQRQHMALQRELAYRPQLHFGMYENEYGLQTPYAVMVNPRTGGSQPVDIGVADKLSGHPGMGPITLQNPLDPNNPIQVYPGQDVKTIRRKLSDVYAEVQAGTQSVDQGRAQYAATQMEAANNALKKENLDQALMSPGRAAVQGVGQTLGPAGRVGAGFLQSFNGGDKYRQALDQGNTFINALLARRPGARREDLMEQFLPGPNDSEQMRLDKQQRRQDAIRDIQAEGSPAYRLQQRQQPQQAASATTGAAGAREDYARAVRRPALVPPGSQYSPSLKRWRDSAGRMYDESGNAVQ